MNKYAYLYTSLLEALVKKAAVENRYVQPSEGNPLTDAWNTAQNAIGDATTGVVNFGKNVATNFGRVNSALEGRPHEEDLFNDRNQQREQMMRNRTGIKTGPISVPPKPAAPAPAAPAPTAGGTAPQSMGTLNPQGITQSMSGPASGPDDAFLKTTMGSYDPNSSKDRQKADAIRKIWKPGMTSNQVYADKGYSSIK